MPFAQRQQAVDAPLHVSEIVARHDAHGELQPVRLVQKRRDVTRRRDLRPPLQAPLQVRLGPGACACGRVLEDVTVLAHAAPHGVRLRVVPPRPQLRPPGMRRRYVLRHAPRFHRAGEAQPQYAVELQQQRQLCVVRQAGTRHRPRQGQRAGHVQVVVHAVQEGLPPLLHVGVAADGLAVPVKADHSHTRLRRRWRPRCAARSAENVKLSRER